MGSAYKHHLLCRNLLLFYLLFLTGFVICVAHRSTIFSVEFFFAGFFSRRFHLFKGRKQISDSQGFKTRLGLRTRSWPKPATEFCSTPKRAWEKEKENSFQKIEMPLNEEKHLNVEGKDES
ncbi:hypothetical protein AMTRI_Chr02g265660 [Amborella trichopoda]